MTKIIMLLLAWVSCWAQVTTINGTDNISASRTTLNNNFSYLAGRTLTGTGAPSSSLCNSGAVGTFYINTDPAALFSTLYICANTAASTYAWEGPYQHNLVIGTNVEAWSANLDLWSGLSPSQQTTGQGSPVFTVLGTTLGNATMGCKAGFDCFTNFGVFVLTTGTVTGLGKWAIVPGFTPTTGIICISQPYDSVTAAYLAANPLISYYALAESNYAWTVASGSSNMASNTSYTFVYLCNVL
jgi:hypothetical protein